MSYYIKGNKERGAEVIKLLESKGGINFNNLNGNDEDIIYYTDKRNKIHLTSNPNKQDIVFLLCEELTLPEKKWTPKRGETVLVRIGKACKWREAVFSFYEEDNQLYDVIGGIAYKYCIPFDLNKLGKVTED